MNWRDELPYLGVSAVIVTKHGKERAIAPRCRDELGLCVQTVVDIDTDLFGTFTGEVERAGNQIEAARAKIAMGFQRHPHARMAIASEGSFGPHPAIPFVAIGRELILLVDRETGAEWTGHDVSPRTNYDTAAVADIESVKAFAERVGFPGHGVIALACRGERPVPALGLNKSLATLDALLATADRLLDRFGAVFLETDMRADRNPTRMRAIERATADLTARFQSRCPNCHYPGYDVREWLTGLPCEDCGERTKLLESNVFRCQACSFSEVRMAGPHAMAEATYCDACNP